MSDDPIEAPSPDIVFREVIRHRLLQGGLHLLEVSLIVVGPSVALPIEIFVIHFVKLTGDT